jgi:hypothetical protein
MALATDTTSYIRMSCLQEQAKRPVNKIHQRTQKHHIPTNHSGAYMYNIRKKTLVMSLCRGRKTQTPQWQTRCRIETALFNIHKSCRAEKYKTVWHLKINILVSLIISIYQRDYTGHYISVRLLEKNYSQIKTLVNIGKKNRWAEGKCKIVLMLDDGQKPESYSKIIVYDLSIHTIVLTEWNNCGMS